MTAIGHKQTFFGKYPKKYNCNSKLYFVYNSMKDRCKNKNTKNYKNYGGRGIKVCEEWNKGYESFFDWAYKNGYYCKKLPNGRTLLTIDRIDNNKGYSPSNCRWVTNEVQARNKKTTVYVEINGEKVNLREYAEEHNIPFMTIYNRIKYLKIPVEDAIKNIDLRKHKRVMEV